jgi:hypothetical protein
MSIDRDRILEQALKHELRAAGTPPAGACLDAETLGAWTDGTLDPTAMASIEAHVSNCARCQAVVGAIARSIPSVESAVEPRGFPLWKWWLAPIAAGVTAVTLWMVVPEQPQLATAPPQQAETKAAQAPSAETIAPTPPAADKKDAALDRSIVAENNKLNAPAREDQPRDRVSEARKEEEALTRNQERVAMADAAAPAAPQAPAAAAEFGALQKSARTAAAPIEIPTLDPARGWRIAGDRIERSDDDGKTWRLMRQSTGEALTAGSAPSNPVCWFVGRGGRVLLTVDSGATFNDVSLAEPLDLASVAAIDARNASVYSVVGRRFRTDDGGRTWRQF